MGFAINAEAEPTMDGRTLLHRFRYHIAKGFVSREDVVLDLGCGTGYGTDILSEIAKQVIGIDIEKSNILYAIEKHKRKNNKFICQDLEKWNFPACDVAVQFENLEHLYNTKAFVTKLKRQVRKFIVVSVPIGESLIEVNGDIQATGDSTHHSAFSTPMDLDILFIDETWKKYFSFQSGVTYIAIYYK